MKPEEVPFISEFSKITFDKLRYNDTDRQGHVNNTVFSSLFETGRVEVLYNTNNPVVDNNCSFVIASMKVDYLFEITWPGEVKIGTRVKKIGNSSIQFFQGLFQNEKCVACAETIIVQMNETTRKSSPLSKNCIDVLQELLYKK